MGAVDRGDVEILIKQTKEFIALIEDYLKDKVYIR